MPLSPKVSVQARNAEADLTCALLNSGRFRIYDGVQPSGPHVPVTTQLLLAELRFDDPAFAQAVDGEASAHPFLPGSFGLVSGEASWFRCLKADGVTAVMDGSVGTVGSNLNLDTTAIAASSPIQINGFVYDRV